MHIRPVRPRRSRPWAFWAALADVFALIVFHLVVDVSPWGGRPHERLGLRVPVVEVAALDTYRDPARLAINILADGTVLVCDERRSDAWCRTCLAVEARISRGQDGYADREILIRADRRTPWRHVRKIIRWCREPDIRIWRLRFAVEATGPEPLLEVRGFER
jgi:hypothetical protein